MSYTVDEAAKQAEMFLKASSGSPVRSVRYELYKRGKEWQRAVEELGVTEELEADQAVIESIGNIGPGMMVIGDHKEPWWPVVKIQNRDGQTSLMLEDGDGRPQWRNFFGPSSPVVVKF
jgi:hypothetical protein